MKKKFDDVSGPEINFVKLTFDGVNELTVYKTNIFVIVSEFFKKFDDVSGPEINFVKLTFDGVADCIFLPLIDFSSR